MSNKKRKNYVWDEIRGLYVVSKRNRTAFIVRIVLITVVVGVALLSFFQREYENLMVCAMACILFILPPFVEKRFGMVIPQPLEIVVLLFIFAAQILGEISGAYAKIPMWDVILHGINGFCCAAIGFTMLDMFNRNREFKFQLPPLYLTFVAFCFSMTIGVLWEFFEFGCDIIIGTDMQKDTWISVIRSVDLLPGGKVTSVKGIKEVIIVMGDGTAQSLNEMGGKGVGYLDIGLIDTMKDLFVDFIGAVVFSIIGFFYVKKRNVKFAEYFMPVFRTKEEMHHFNVQIKEEMRRRRTREAKQTEKARVASETELAPSGDDGSADTSPASPKDEGTDVLTETGEVPVNEDDKK